MLDELIEKVPNFRKAYVCHQLQVDEFESFPPVVRFRRQFENGWNAGLEYIRRFRQK